MNASPECLMCDGSAQAGVAPQAAHTRLHNAAREFYEVRAAPSNTATVRMRA
jgi:hypothetical protein